MTHPAPNSPDGEKILTIITGGLIAACLMVWTAGQVATRLWDGTWMHVPLLESPLILWKLIVNPGQPVQAWPPAAGDLLPDPLPYYATLIFLVAVLIGAGALGYRWHDRHQNSSNGESARWAKPRDLKPLLIRRPQPGRLTLGTVNRRLIATEAQHSVAVIGPAGTGKTTGFAIPALLEWDGPVIATSVKGDLLEHT
ncbi:MAG: type IV secretory system conjugative DNA transfer family protein, partial [Acidimicrobiia bacterium]|nr:type IV secretory system conjugative DNA transfer family protein [Acidimicrobiia bacterium]